MGYILLSILLISTIIEASILPKITAVVFKVEPSELSDSLIYPTRIDPKVNSLVYSEYDGVVTKIMKPLGSVVKKNEKILLIKHTDPVYQYAPAALIAAVSGVVSQMKVTEGTNVTKGQLVGSVTDPTQVIASFDVAALDVVFFKKGLEGRLTISGLPQPIRVAVKGISPFVDPATGTAQCELEIQDKRFISPGLVGRTEFKVNQRKGVTLPEQALVYKGNDPFVRVVVDSKATRIPVVVGKKQNSQVEILSGVEGGQVVIERASGFLADGDEVVVQSKDETKDQAKAVEKTE